MKRNAAAHWKSAAISILIGLIAVGSPSPVFALSNVTFSGQATAVRATALGTTTVLSDTGPLPSSGGEREASLLSASIPWLLSAEVLHAATIGQGDRSRSEASIANLSLTVAGNSIAADFLMSRASAACSPKGPVTSGSSEILNLVINGQAVTVSGQPNQTVALPANSGKVIINEQTTSSSNQTGEITVNALHVIVNTPDGGTQEVVIASAHADISCNGNANCQAPRDFVTGGGWIPISGSKGTFGVAGGIKNGDLWGHLVYQDHGTRMRVRGLGVTAYVVTGATSRHIEGVAEINGVGGFTYQVDVSDNGEPGRSDTFSIKLSNGYTASGTLSGGNIQLHKPCV